MRRIQAFGALFWSASLVLLACGSRTALEIDSLPDASLDGSLDASAVDSGIRDSGRDAIVDTGTDARKPRCGDGILDPGEQCDDGNAVDSDSCRANCTPARCGDGAVRVGVELCDDGNNLDGDGCSAQCGPETCGDGKVQGREACDDGNTSNTDACLTSCALAFCGDSFVRTGVEECDDGNTLNTDACVGSCKKARCGDGFVQTGVEECDDGNPLDTDFCDNNCKNPVCGDGKRAGNEECDLGPLNGDRPAFLISQPSGTSIATNPLVRKQTSQEFYDFRSASSHTGFEAVGESRVYLYVDSNTGRLSLVLTHGIDEDSSGQSQPTSEVEMDVAGIPPGFAIDVADDRASEFFSTGPQSAAGRWRFQGNSDGGVLGGLPFPGVWKITVTPRFIEGISSWGYVRDDLARIGLNMNEPITIEAFDQSSACNRQCKVPRCGDGKLDGGEVCDDGNQVGGDGCAANCKSLR
jgi:cysteine-rich repeat protein